MPEPYPLQKVTARVLIVCVFAVGAILTIGAWVISGPDAALAGALALVALSVVLLVLRQPSRLIGFALAAALVVEASLLVWMSAGQPWHPAAYAAYFVILAGLGGLGESTVLIAAAVMIVAAWLMMTVALPGFPNGSDYVGAGAYAVMLAVETVVLVALTRALRSAYQATAIVRSAEPAAALVDAKAHERNDYAAAKQRVEHMGQLLDRIRREMASSADDLNAATQNMQGNAEALGRASARVSAQTVMAGLASEQTEEKVKSAALAGDGLAQTISEVGSNAVQSSQLAAEAVAEVAKTSTKFTELAVIAEEIGKVTDLIKAIAGQTNLLALNATIEAARAGEAGRGFAIVAQEVKALASQTAAATQDIGTRIQTMQAATGRSVDAAQAILRTIQNLDTFSARIATAVDQQASAARDIAGNVNAAAGSVGQVNSSIREIEGVADETARAAGSLTAIAMRVADRTQKVSEQMTALTDEIRELRA